MKKLLISVLIIFLTSCTGSEVEKLKVENEALKQEVEKIRQLAQQEAANGREAEARALLAQQEAERAMAMARAAEADAAKALKDCQGK